MSIVRNMKVMRRIKAWWAGVMLRHHMSKRDRAIRVAQMLDECGEGLLAAEVRAEADIQEAYARRWADRLQRAIS